MTNEKTIDFVVDCLSVSICPVDSGHKDYAARNNEEVANLLANHGYRPAGTTILAANGVAQQYVHSDAVVTRQSGNHLGRGVIASEDHTEFYVVSGRKMKVAKTIIALSIFHNERCDDVLARMNTYESESPP